jgi:hypothetical protein
MNLHPDKVAAGILYKMYAHDNNMGGNDQLNDVFEGVASAAAVRAQLGRLVDLGLIIKFGLPENDVWSLTHEGHELAFRLVSKPNSFMARLQQHGLPWLRESEAAKAQMTPVFRRYEVDTILNDDTGTPNEVVPFNWTKWGTILAGLSIAVAIGIAVLS